MQHIQCVRFAERDKKFSSGRTEQIPQIGVHILFRHDSGRRLREPISEPIWSQGFPEHKKGERRSKMPTSHQVCFAAIHNRELPVQGYVAVCIWGADIGGHNGSRSIFGNFTNYWHELRSHKTAASFFFRQNIPCQGFSAVVDVVMAQNVTRRNRVDHQGWLQIRIIGPFV